MGYIILGIIILLLLTVFMTDLFRGYRDTDDDTYRTYRGQPYHSEFGDDFVNDDLDDLIDDYDIDRGFIWNNSSMNNPMFPNQNPNMTEFSDDIDFDVLDDDIDDNKDDLFND